MLVVHVGACARLERLLFHKGVIPLFLSSNLECSRLAVVQVLSIHEVVGSGAWVVILNGHSVGVVPNCAGMHRA